MEVLIINDKEILRDIVTSYDILINSSPKIFGKINTSGDICIARTAEFHGPVQCKNISVIDPTTPVRFKKDIHCKKFASDGGVYSDATMHVEEQFSYDGYTFRGALIVNGSRIDPYPNGTRSYPKPNAVVPYLNQAVVPVEFCAHCGLLGEGNVLQGASSSGFICYDCADELLPQPQSQDFKRHPYEWELQYFSEEEHEFYAKNHYVDFPVRYPDKPFIHIVQESQEGDVIFKEILISDPSHQYLSEEDEEYYTKRLTYNGGPLAASLLGISSGLTFSMILAVAPVIGPFVASVAFACSLPINWKMSKKTSDWITEKVILPHEIHIRKALIEGRRQDEETRQKSEIVII